MNRDPSPAMAAGSGLQKDAQRAARLGFRLQMANILIVEDEPRMRRLLEITLGEDGHNVQTAEDAEKGLAFLRREAADLVVTDLKLPGMNGLEFLQEGKRLNSSLPFIVMTAYGSVETAGDAMKAGATD